jgi:hypothetical protein
MHTPALQRLHRFTHLLYLRRQLAFELQVRAAGGSARAVAPDPVSAGGGGRHPVTECAARAIAAKWSWAEQAELRSRLKKDLFAWKLLPNARCPTASKKGGH